MKIVVVSGTYREGRKSHGVAVCLNRELLSLGYTTELVDLKAYNLPVLEYIYAKHPAPTEAMHKLHSIFDSADAFILVTPEYNGAPAASLKNSLDYFRKEYYRKVMGICTVSSGALGGMRAATSLQQMVLWYGGVPVSQMLTVPKVQNHFDEEGNLSDSEFKPNIDKFIESFLWLSDAVMVKRNS